MRLRWTTPAAEDLYRIVQHIQEDNPTAAAEVAKTIYDGCGTLEDFPRRGRAGRIPGTRELIVSGCRTSLCIRLKNRASRFYAFTTARRIGRRCRLPHALLPVSVRGGRGSLKFCGRLAAE